MRHDDEGECSGPEQAFQPLDAFKIEVVCRLVEQQDVRIGDEGFGNRKALAPAAAQARRFAVHAGIAAAVVFRKAGATECFAKALLALTGRDGGAIQSLFDVLAHGDARSEIGDLMHVADTGALAKRDFAGVGLVLGAENGEQRGFACAIGPDQADTVAIVDGERDTVEERIGAEALGDILRDQNRRHVSSLRGRARRHAAARNLAFQV